MIVVMDNGRVIEQGSYAQLIENKGHLAKLVDQFVTKQKDKDEEEEKEDKDQDQETTEEKRAKIEKRIDFTLKKLVEKEEAQVGRVKLNIYWRFVQAISLGWGLVFTIGYLLSNASSALSAVWLSEWSRRIEEETDHSTLYYLSVYGAVGIGQGLFASFAWAAMSKGVLAGAFKLHNNMLIRILKCPISFFDVTPLGRILNRFSKDIDVCDSTIQENIR